jgi:hypothetical protein
MPDVVFGRTKIIAELDNPLDHLLPPLVILLIETRSPVDVGLLSGDLI